MQRMIDGILNWLSAGGLIPEEERPVYAYGLDLLLYTLLSTSGLVLLAALAGLALPGAVMITLYCLTQAIGGGFHATSHLRCFLLMVAGLAASLLLYRLLLPYAYLAAASMPAALLALYLLPVVLHPGRGWSGKQIAHAVRRSRLYTLVLAALALGAVFTRNPSLILACSLGLADAALSRGAALLFKRGTLHR